MNLFLKHLLLIASLASGLKLGADTLAPADPSPITGSDNSYHGRWVEGTGEPKRLAALEAAYESTRTSSRMACLPLLYKRDWDGFVEGPPWLAWWTQNSFGPTYGLLPFLGEPYATWVEHSQSMWFCQMGDGVRKDKNGFQAPDGCLCDAAFFELSGGATNGFGDARKLGRNAGTPVDGTIIRQGTWYRQGDGDPKRYDWFIGATAAGLILESERLLVRHDPAAAKKRLPELERVAAFLDSRRDHETNLLKGGMSSNLLAPAYSGVRNPDGTFGMAYLTELSVNYVAGLERLAEVCSLSGESAGAAAYRATAAKVRKALPKLMTAEGCFIMSEDPDGTRHGVYAAPVHGYFEATPNHDAGCFEVTDDATNKAIITGMLSLKGATAPGGLAPHGLIIPNYPGYDDSVHGGRYGHWVNGGHWSTTQARMSIAALRADEFDHPFGAWAKIRGLMEIYRADAPLTDFGASPWSDKLRAPYCVVYDCWGAPGGLLRGILEYDYRADSLRVRPHLPQGITRYVQKFPVWFGKTKIFFTVTGSGACDWTELHPSGQPGVLAVEITRGRTAPRIVWKPGSEQGAENRDPGLSSDSGDEPVNFDGLPADLKPLAAFYRAMVRAGLRESYEAAQARLAIELFAARQVRIREKPPASGLDSIPACDPAAVNQLYFNTATWMAGGLKDRLEKRDLWRTSVSPEILRIAREAKLIP